MSNLTLGEHLSRLEASMGSTTETFWMTETMAETRMSEFLGSGDVVEKEEEEEEEGEEVEYVLADEGEYRKT